MCRLLGHRLLAGGTFLHSRKECRSQPMQQQAVAVEAFKPMQRCWRRLLLPWLQEHKEQLLLLLLLPRVQEQDLFPRFQEQDLFRRSGCSQRW